MELALGQECPAERRILMAEELLDIPFETLKEGIKRLRGNWTGFVFPKAGDIRSACGFSQELIQEVEAEASWQSVWAYLRRWGVDLMPVRHDGDQIEAPKLEPRTAYALRTIGGLSALNQVTVDHLPFMRKDFFAAFKQAPLAAALQPQLEAKLSKQLEGKIKQISDGKRLDRQPKKIAPVPTIAELSPERREEIRNKVNDALAKRGGKQDGASE